LYNKKPKKVNGINLVYTPSVNSKVFSQLFNSFFSFFHVCFSKSDVVLVVNSANGPFGILTRIFRKKTCINVDGLEWLRPKWKGLGSIYFKFSSKLSTIFFDEIITDSVEMNKVYKQKFGKKSTVIAYGPTMGLDKNPKILKELELEKNEYYLIVGRLIPDNNSKIIIESFLKSKSSKKLVIVGDVPYLDKYSSEIKNYASENIIFLGYIKSNEILTCLYENCFAYIHGHQYGGTNPTMINALKLNCNIISLRTVFTLEMLKGKKVVFFEKKIDSISNAFKFFEKDYYDLEIQNKSYVMPKKYNWDFITKKYIKVFNKLLK